MGEGFFDIEYGIGIVCRRYPSEMLHQCGLAKFLRYAIIGNETMDPAAVWLLRFYTSNVTPSAVSVQLSASRGC